ncbi:hypothetical protein [Clostridium senegalense]|nr:hypothetical protein [Clostridium senegalense]
MNEAINKMHEDGKLTEISEKWFRLDTTKESN